MKIRDNLFKVLEEKIKYWMDPQKNELTQTQTNSLKEHKILKEFLYCCWKIGSNQVC